MTFCVRFSVNFAFFICSSIMVLEGVRSESLRRVVVVGGGLAGLSATLSAIKSGAHVTLIDGEKNSGGNSAKATSGINACETSTQRERGVNDNCAIFSVDTLKAGHGINNEELVEILVSQSADAIERLKSMGIDLSDVVILGGHSVKRTHRIPSKNGKPMPVGFTIVRGVQSELEKINSTHAGQFDALYSTIAKKLITNNYGDVVGVQVQDANSQQVYTIDADAVILATGGYSNDRTSDSLLEEFAPEKLRYPTTNGPFALGAGVKMAREIGAKLVDMDKVQIHPTGFVDDKSPMEKTKFLAAEALRGSGGLLLNEKGRRFADELGARDYLTAKIEKFCKVDPECNGHVAFMVLNDDAADRFGRPSFGFYWQVKKFFKKFKNGQELAVHMNLAPSTLKGVFDAYSRSAASGEDEFGKKVFPTLFDWEKPFYLAKITPVIHYTMGGVAINNKTNVLRNDDSVIGGLFAAGEVSGGVHGANRLGGNSLLECAVFGHIAGRQAAQNRSFMSGDL